MAQKNILIVCGEASGELHASGLAFSLKKLDPNLKVYAVGSELLRQNGAEIIFDIRGLAVFGFFDALRKLPRFLALKKYLLDKIKEKGIGQVILVDFSGFNLRLAKAINNSVETIYYVSPQVWASRPGRIKTIKKYIRSLIVIFKFEEEYYKKFGVKAEFVGHPLLDKAIPSAPKSELLKNLGLSESKMTLALLPGSRKQEIRNILPIMLRASAIISQKIQLQLILAKPEQLFWDTYKPLIEKSGLQVKVIEGKTYDCLNIADFALVCSGTATIEAAIMQTPFAIIYKMGLLTYLLYKPQVKVPFIGMVNIVAGKKIIPEFIQSGASAKNIAAFTLKAMQNPSYMQQLKNDLAKIKLLLGEPGAAERAARIIKNGVR